MDPPTDGIELKPKKLEEEKEGGPLFHCDFCDADVVDKIAQSFLPGLASACIDNTTGGLFKTPATVAVDIRREMVDYLIQRSENFVAESVVLEGGPDVEVSVDPYDIISDFVDDFVHSKRNFFSRVSGWLLSEKREDWIDDLVQEMEINGFWLLNRRSTVGQTLLKNLDFRNTYHCNMNFKSPEDLEKHKLNCGFRTLSCTNEGCDSSFSAAQMDHHDSTCPFKMLPCEQNCPDIIMRRDMDRHCITTCPMKLVKCPFHSVGCQSTIPQRTIEQHRSQNLTTHLLYIIQVSHKEASSEDLIERAQQLEKLASPGRLASARDARSLTYVIKDLETKLGPVMVKTNTKSDEEVKDLVDLREETTDTQAKHVKSEDKSLDDKYEEKTSMAIKQVRFDEVPVPAEKEATATANSHSFHGNGLVQSPGDVSASSKTNEDEVVASISAQQNSKDSPSQSQREEGLTSPAKFDEQMEKSSKEEEVNPIKEEHYVPTIQQQDKLAESTMEEQKHAQPTANSEVFTESPAKESSSSVSTTASARHGELGLGAMNGDAEEVSGPVKKDMESLNSAQ